MDYVLAAGGWAIGGWLPAVKSMSLMVLGGGRNWALAMAGPSGTSTSAVAAEGGLQSFVRKVPPTFRHLADPAAAILCSEVDLILI